ncbi:hypothetical protein GF342_05110 [Candidatus Woesearchaeota archaeon]|nr:hypothetical protein [Candidatus Woesearchaeota archaeon]
MKRLLLLLPLILLTTAVIAPVGDIYTVTVDLHKGWNLVAGLLDLSQQVGGTFDVTDAGSLWVFHHQNQQWAQVYPTFNTTQIGNLQPADVIHKTGFLYVTQDSTLEYEVPIANNIQNLNVGKGWEVIGAHTFYDGKVAPQPSLAACTNLHAWSWDASTQAWIDLSTLWPQFTKVITITDASVGLLLHSDGCSFIV